MDLCLLLAGQLWLRSAAPVTLAWRHSVEHFEVEEVFQASGPGVSTVETRVRGLGAGVDVPPDAHWVDGWWRFVPASQPQPSIRFANALQQGGLRVCAQGRCSALPSQGELVLRPCDGP